MKSLWNAQKHNPSYLLFERVYFSITKKAINESKEKGDISCKTAQMSSCEMFRYTVGFQREGCKNDCVHCIKDKIWLTFSQVPNCRCQVDLFLRTF